MNKTNWKSFNLTEDCETRFDYHRDPATYTKAMREMYEYGSMSQVYFWPDAERGEHIDNGADGWHDFGPSRDEIDWIGLTGDE